MGWLVRAGRATVGREELVFGKASGWIFRQRAAPVGGSVEFSGEPKSTSTEDGTRYRNFDAYGCRLQRSQLLTRGRADYI